MEHASDLEKKLLGIVQEFIAEFKSERAQQAVSLNASLERDLGVDSLARVELFLRIEKAFGVSLPEKLMIEAERLKDIAETLKKAEPTKQKISREFAEVLDSSPQKDVSSAQTLIEVLIQHCHDHPKRPHIYLQDEKGEEKIIRYGELLENAKKIAAGLLDIGIKQQETVAIMLPTSEEFFYTFFGVLLAGAVPVPIYPPLRPDKIEEYALREANILNNAEVRILITFSQVETLSNLLKIFIRSLRSVTTVDSLMQSKHRIPTVILESHDSALIQYTSGSTSDPKGVLLSHANLLANLRSVGKAAHLTPNDVGISWLPLYHDMGLIGAWLGTLYHGFPLTIMSPLTFLSRPERWLWAIHYHRGTVSAGPNFAYELCVRKIKDEDIQGLDLSSWRLAFNGAEMINPKTLERFIEKFKPYGFKAEAFFPVYGLAESTVGLTMPPLNREPRVDLILREAFEKEQRADIPGNIATNTPPSFTATAATADKNILQFVSCGFPIPDHEIRIVDDKMQELSERQIGSLQFSGPSAMQSYYRNPAATEKIYHEGWWDSGDLAYLAEGEVFITGRKKDIIIKAGRNLYPQEIEEIAAHVSGVRKGCVVAFGVDDPKWGTEKLVIVAEVNETKGTEKEKIRSQILENISVVLGIPPDQVVLVAPRIIPKTSSGKLQRAACKKMFLEGKLIRKGLPVWAQMIKLSLKGASLTALRYLEKIARIFYTAYMVIITLLLLPITWFFTLILPKHSAIRFARLMVRLFIFLSGCPFKVDGKNNLSEKQPLIYIANHASYLDSLLLLAILPPDTIVVGKKELESVPIIKTFIRKFGFLSVDRIDFTKSISDSKTIEDSIHQGKSVLIFPEGTFAYTMGLRPFKMGAFKLAVDTGRPLCPIAIQGTRFLMTGNSWLLNPGKIKITISPIIQPQAFDWSEVSRLHSLARAEIAKNSGELSINLVMAGPDLQSDQKSV